MALNCGFHYVILKYRPDPIRGEYVNVGVIVQDRDTGKTYVRVDPTLERAKALFPELNEASLRLFLDLVVEAFDGAEHTFGVLERESSSQGPYSMLVMSDVRGGLSHRSAEEVERLYERFVEPLK